MKEQIEKLANKLYELGNNEPYLHMDNSLLFIIKYLTLIAKDSGNKIRKDAIPDFARELIEPELIKKGVTII